MQRDRLHPQVVQGIRDPIVVDLTELRGGQVGDHRHVGSHGLDREVIEHVGVLQPHAHRAESHRDPARLRRDRQVTVGVAALVRAAGHAGDHQRQSQIGAKEVGRGVDLLQVQLRQRFVLEANQLETGAYRAGDVRLRTVDARFQMALLA